MNREGKKEMQFLHHQATEALLDEPTDATSAPPLHHSRSLMETRPPQRQRDSLTERCESQPQLTPLMMRLTLSFFLKLKKASTDLLYKLQLVHTTKTGE